MIWLARGLARRKRRAWELAVVLVAASAAAHLVRGLDIEEATVHLALLVALFRARRQFVAPGDPTTMRPLVQVVVALGVVTGLLLAELYLTDDTSLRIERGARARGRRARVPGALAVAPSTAVRRRARRTRESGRPRSSTSDGEDSLAYFALRRDKAYVFSPSGRSFLAYRVIGGTALIAGDPIGDPTERRRAGRRVRACRARQGVARRDRGRRRRGARGLRGARVQVDLPR